jgi:ribosomal protein S18 acetylase RimI-like enzyme
MIRKCTPATDPSDFEELKAAYLELFNEPDALKYLSYTFLPFDDETVSNWFNTHVESGVNYYAALDPDGQIIGIGVVKSSLPYGFELLGLAVRRGFRRQGVGRQLVEHIMGVAQEAGYIAVDVSVFADNKPMLQLVIDLDFLPASITHRARADGADVVLLKKYLDRDFGQS